MGSIKEAQYDRFDREIMYKKFSLENGCIYGGNSILK